MLDTDRFRQRQLSAADAAAVVDSFIDPWRASTASERASNFVHQMSQNVETAVSIASTAGAAALAGSVLVGVGAPAVLVGLGAVLVGALIGVPVGQAVGHFLGGVVERVGAAIVNALGMDFITSGKTPSGGDWRKVQHPDGTWQREEKAGGLTVNEWTDGYGYHQTIDGNGYHSDYNRGPQGSSFNARDSAGGMHVIETDAHGNRISGDSNGKGNSNIHTSDGKGNSSDFTTRTDADGRTTTTETNTTRDEKTGVTTTTTTVTDSNGNEETTTTYTDDDGEPVDPPDKDDGGMENPDGDGQERPRVRPGELGQPRPGHPEDMVLAPGQGSDAGDDYNEGPTRFYVSLSAAMQAMAVLMSAGTGSGWGNSDGEESRDDVRRKLLGLTFTGSATGEDFIHPNALGALLGRIARAIINGRI